MRHRSSKVWRRLSVFRMRFEQRVHQIEVLVFVAHFANRRTFFFLQLLRRFWTASFHRLIVTLGSPAYLPLSTLLD
jgi:hypothetical protein